MHPIVKGSSSTKKKVQYFQKVNIGIWLDNWSGITLMTSFFTASCSAGRVVVPNFTRILSLLCHTVSKPVSQTSKIIINSCLKYTLRVLWSGDALQGLACSSRLKKSSSWAHLKEPSPTPKRPSPQCTLDSCRLWL